jgi:hypothetical protein
VFTRILRSLIILGFGLGVFILLMASLEWLTSPHDACRIGLDICLR